MKQKIFNNVFLHLAINLIINSGLWFLFMYGGSLSVARSHPKFFWSDFYHVAIATIIITLIGRWTSVRPKSYLPSNNQKSVLSILSIIAQKSFWSIIDVFSFLFWLALDSWRKPSVELFARMSANECVKMMVDACNEELTIADLEGESPITGHFGKSYFSILKWAPTPFGRVAVIPSTVLYGKINDVQQGMFIRAWHRLPTTLLLFIALWFGGLTSLIIDFVRTEITYLPDLVASALIILGIAGWLLFFMWISTKFARETKNELKVFLINVFSRATVAQHSVHPTGGSRRVFR